MENTVIDADPRSRKELDRYAQVCIQLVLR